MQSNSGPSFSGRQIPAIRTLRSRSLRGTLVVAVPLLLILIHSACNTSTKLTPIPGTEGVQYNGCDAISVSPDEQWVVFWVMADEPSHPYDERLASLHIETGSLTKHSARSLSPNVVSGHLPLWSMLLITFDPQGWRDGLFFIRAHDRSLRADIALTPGVPDLIEGVSPLDGTCSDCGPQNALDRIARKRVRGGDKGCEYTIAYRDSSYSRTLYLNGSKQSRARILRVAAGGDTTCVYSQDSWMFDLSIGAIRVSPDERFIAFTLGRALAAPLPTATTYQVRVFDLVSEETRVASGRFELTTNLMWSRNGSRLYFGGITRDTGNIYVADIEQLFK